MNEKSILIVDDEKSIRQTLQQILTEEGYVVSEVDSGMAALDHLKQGNYPDVILLDIWMTGMDGLETLKQIREFRNDAVVVMMSGHGTIETAVKATKIGAFDFIEKPPSLEKLLMVLSHATQVVQLKRENQTLRTHLKKNRELLGSSPFIAQIQELIRRVAKTSGSVLITGENGTGKELVAHMVHSLSQRSQKPLIEVNCAAIPEELIESELFGHEKGSFTGATQLRRGKFDLAHGGTLFLDEIGDMSLKTQAKILRILQEQKFERIGGSQTFTVDVRIVAATNKDLKQEIQRGTFREDLFYRLNVVPVHLQPLRERAEDIPVMADSFLQEFSITNQKKPRALTEPVLRLLQGYAWPGNVRELKNLMERIMILTSESEEGSPIGEEEVANYLGVDLKTIAGHSAIDANHKKGLKDARIDFEKDYILKVLAENQGNVSKAAQAMGLERSHLHKKMKQYGIENKNET